MTALLYAQLTCSVRNFSVSLQAEVKTSALPYQIYNQALQASSLVRLLACSTHSGSRHVWFWQMLRQTEPGRDY